MQGYHLSPVGAYRQCASWPVIHPMLEQILEFPGEGLQCGEQRVARGRKVCKQKGGESLKIQSLNKCFPLVATISCALLDQVIKMPARTIFVRPDAETCQKCAEGGARSSIHPQGTFFMIFQ